jgi:DHA1 family bicyclomycin/chloramphenicol resistance-like MFS transporter
MTASPARSTWLDRRSPPHILTLVALASIGALNMNMFLPSLPSMAADFGAEYAVVQLAVSAYLAATAALQLVIGPLSDRFGRRAVMLGALTVFLAATLGCVLATTVEAFLAWRLLSAAVVAGLVLSRAAVRDMVGPAEAASMIGYVTMGMALSPMVGPMLGGALDQVYGWRATFVLLLSLGAFVLWLTWRDLGETHHRRSSSMLEQVRAYPELARSRRFWGYALTAACASGAFFAFLGGAPYVASDVLGMSPAESGFWFGSLAIGYAFGNFLSGRFTAMVGLNRMMLAGTLIAVAGVASSLYIFSHGYATALGFFGPLALVGVGNGLSMPSSNAGMLSVRPKLAGSASGLGGALMIGGGAALSALSGALLGPGTGPYPLLYVMLASSSLSVLAVAYVLYVEKVAGPLPRL